MTNFRKQVPPENEKQSLALKSAQVLPRAEPTQGQLNALVSLLYQGRLNEVVQQATSMVAEFPNAVVLYNILGAANKGMGNLDGAICSFKMALQVKPDFVEAHNNIGIVLREQGCLDEAVASFRSALQIRPEFAEAHNNLGIALQGLGRIDDAAASFAQALHFRANYAEALSNLGVALQGQGRMDEAIASFSKAVKIKPGFAEAHNNLGMALKELNRVEEAIENFGKAVRIKPDYFEAHNSLGLLLQGLDRMEEAMACFRKALLIKPDYADAHNSLGCALEAQGRPAEAIACFNKALKIKPDYAEVYSNLCRFYERQNNLEEFERTVLTATRNCGEDSVQILFWLGQLAGRKNDPDAAVAYLRRVPIEKLDPLQKPAYFGVLGKSYDRLGRFEEAFSAFVEQNELIKASTEAKKFSMDEYLKSIEMMKNDWSGLVTPNWLRLPVGSGRPPPTFLVGFPRSGTTLLDTILRSHPGISVVEEKPMVTKMLNSFKLRQTIERLDAFSESDISALRDAYFEELKVHLDHNNGGKLVVDKFPLNIAHVGSIHRVFPDAKFVLVLRHPCDCVLSCFMQNFKLNPAMMNFLRLDQSAKLYAAVMELWSAYRQKLDLEVHVVKYEELVQDLEGSCKPLIRFLGLEWDDNLHNYQKTASERGSINTPSYSQVVQPLYKRARGRWINYRRQMEPVLPVLQPWIDALGY